MASLRSFLLLALLVLSVFCAAAQDANSDRAALLALRAAVGRAVLPWNSSDTLCSWRGISCRLGRVAVLRLPGSGLIGRIPEGSIGNLTALRTLSLRLNAISGTLPSDLSGAAQLRNVYLQGNRLSGDFPAIVSSLPRLIRLNLAGNELSGEIPGSLGNLTRLTTLLLESNNFSGSIPDLHLPLLAQFNVSFNNLNGSIPASLRKMPASSFLGMKRLCGGPLGPCPGETAPAPAPAPAAGPASHLIPHSPAHGSGGGGGSSSKLSGGAIAGIAVGSAVAFLLFLALLIFLCRKKRSGASTAHAAELSAVSKPPEAGEVGREDRRAAGGSGTAAAAAAAAAKGDGGSVKKLVFVGGKEGDFDLEDLLRASAEVLGKGTFGTAYKAVLEMGAVVAVKRLRDVTLLETQFRERVEAIGAMNHPNIVQLRAYYYSKDEKLIVYDYMPMGSLSALLHGNRGSGRTPLNWEMRSGIALATARGIAYIHSTGPDVSHGNIKSSNVLLDKLNDARVSDHGLARFVISTSATRGSGYRAPEVTDVRKVSQRADMYSFGVLLLELLTGKPPSQALLNEEGVDLPRWVQSVVREEWTSQVFDAELLMYQNVEEEMVQLLQLGVDCAAQYPDRRPSMAEVVARIEEIRQSSLGSRNQGQQLDQHHSIDDGVEPSSGHSLSIDESRPSEADNRV